MDDQELARRFVRRMTRWTAMPVKSASLQIEFIDGRSTVLPLFLGESPTPKEQDANAASRIMASAPAKDAEPMKMKAILRLAGLAWSQTNRNKLWELVEKGDLVALRDGFRKAK